MFIPSSLSQTTAGPLLARSAVTVVAGVAVTVTLAVAVTAVPLALVTVRCVEWWWPWGSRSRLARWRRSDCPE